MTLRFFPKLPNFLRLWGNPKVERLGRYKIKLYGLESDIFVNICLFPILKTNIRSILFLTTFIFSRLMSLFNSLGIFGIIVPSIHQSLRSFVCRSSSVKCGNLDRYAFVLGFTVSMID